MTATLDIDLSAQPAPRPKPAATWKPYVPWGLLAVALVALALSLAPPRTPPAPPAEPAPVPETRIDLGQTGGLSDGATVWRDSTGLIVAVMHQVRPYVDEAVACRLVVDGREVIAEAADGLPALCVWVRGAA